MIPSNPFNLQGAFAGKAWHGMALGGWGEFIRYTTPQKHEAPCKAPKPEKPQLPPHFRAGVGKVAFLAVERCMRDEGFIPTAKDLQDLYSIERKRSELTDEVVRWALGCRVSPTRQAIALCWTIKRDLSYHWADQLGHIRVIASAMQIDYREAETA